MSLFKIGKENFYAFVACLALAVALGSTLFDHVEKPNVDRLVCTKANKITYATEWQPKKCEICGWTLDPAKGNFTRDNAFHNTALGETCLIEARKDNYEAQTLERHSP